VDVDVDVDVHVDMDVDGIPYSIYYNHMISNMRDVINMGSANLICNITLSLYIYTYTTIVTWHLCICNSVAIYLGLNIFERTIYIIIYTYTLW
jgi:hypothetical protein